jgi:hypothetical protein
MVISRARIRSLPKSLKRAISSSVGIYKEFGFNEARRKIFVLAFKDVNFRQYDFEGELLSIRRGISDVEAFVNEQIPELDTFFKIENLLVNTDLGHTLQGYFQKYGSDKGNSSSLPLLYASILGSVMGQSSEISLLEIGLGTNNVDVESNMGVSGKPGASVRAFRDFLRPQDKVVGADVDVRILFQSPGIETYFVDQLSQASLVQLGNQVGNLDLIIDDGLHILESNVNTVLSLLGNLKRNGYMIVEDISNLPENLISWKVLAKRLNEMTFRASLVRLDKYTLFVIFKQ